MSPDSYPTPNSSLEKRLLAYSAAAGLAIAMAPSADAQVVYTDVDPDEIVDSDTADSAFFEVDIDGDGTADIQFRQFTGEAGGEPRPAAAVSEAASGTAFAGYVGPYFNYLFALDEGAMIEEGDDPFLNDDFNVLGTTYGAAGPYGQWAGEGQTDKYIGVKFVAGAGTTHFAWVLLDVAPNSEQITVKGYAFESTPNTGIMAGDGISIATEPGALEDGYLFSEVAPNPIASGRASFNLAVGEAEAVSVDVFDAIGRRVQTVFSGAMVPGTTQTVDLDTSALPGGVYVVRVSGESFVSTRNVTVVR